MGDRAQFSIERDEEEEASLFDVDSENNECFHWYKTTDNNEDEEMNSQNKKKGIETEIAKKKCEI